MSVRLLLNGTQVAGSFIQNVTISTVVIEPAISNTLLVNVTSANSTLILQNGPLGRACNDHSRCNYSKFKCSENFIEKSKTQGMSFRHTLCFDVK